MWIFLGLVGGLIVGAMAGATGLFVVLGLGVGLVVQVVRARTAKETGPEPEAQATELAVLPESQTWDQRLSRIEAQLQAIQVRLGRLEKLGVPGIARETSPADSAQPVAPLPVPPAPVSAAPLQAKRPDTSAPVPVSEATPHAAMNQARTAPPIAPAPKAPPVEKPQRAVPEPDPIRARPPAGEAPSLMPDWLSGLFSGNIVAKIGVLILFFGVGFLLKYAAERGMLPPQFRVMAVAITGLAMIVAGWNLVARRRIFGLVLQGGGVGLLYLAVYFMLHWYGMIGAPFGFALFAALGVSTMILALLQNASVLAVLGLTGAFLAPLLAATGSGNHVMLFSYYALLNCFIAAIAWAKAWRMLNVTGFLFTFVVGFAWGWQFYQPQHFATVEPFLIFFFVLYVLLPVLFALRQPPDLRGLVDGTLVFGVPVAAIFLQAPLVRDFEHGLAWSAVGAGLLYLLNWLFIRRNGALKLLGETHLSLGVVFLTLAVPFAFDHYPTFGLWTLEGAALVWLGLRQERLLARCFGYLVHLGGVFFLLRDYPSYSFENPVFNGFVLGCVMITLAAIVMALALRGRRQEITGVEQGLLALLPWWGALWWYAGGLHALDHGLSERLLPAGLLGFAAATSALCELAGRRIDWPALRTVAALMTVALFVALALGVSRDVSHPLEHWGVVAWPFALIVHFWSIYRRDQDAADHTTVFQYIVGVVIAVFVASWEAQWAISRDYYLLGFAWGLAGIGVAWLRWKLRERDVEKPVPLSLLVLLWGIVVWFGSGLSWSADNLPFEQQPAAALGLAAVSCFLFELIGRALAWPALRHTQLLVLLAMAIAAPAMAYFGVQPFDWPGSLAWPAALTSLYVTLSRQERDEVAFDPKLQHFAALMIFTGVLAWQAHEWLEAALPGSRSWSASAWILVPVLVMLSLTWLVSRIEWPFTRHANIYLASYGRILLAAAAVWSIYANFNLSGDSQPLPYFPVLNPIDVTHILVLVAALAWQGRMREANPDDAPLTDIFGGPLGAVTAGVAFIWINAVLLRCLHHWTGVAFELRAMIDSVLAQASLSLLWTSIALVGMIHAVQAARRLQWMAGAVLLGVVVLKLFALDLANTGTLARIVSFLGVGGLLLAVGYFAPVPPGGKESEG